MRGAVAERLQTSLDLKSLKMEQDRAVLFNIPSSNLWLSSESKTYKEYTGQYNKYSFFPS